MHQLPQRLFTVVTVMIFVSLAGPARVSAQDDLPPDAAYVVVNDDGHLSLNGERQRYWGAIGSFPGPDQPHDGDPYYGQRKTVQRLKDMGFNMVRFWHYRGDSDYTKGDGSARDRIDFFFAECAREGIAIWPAGLGGGAFTLYEPDVDEAVKIVDEPASAEEWKQAARAMQKTDWRSPDVRASRPAYDLVGIWDPRMQALMIREMREAAQHVNQHTGYRYSDDPVNVVWELSNEQWFVPNMVRGKWQRLPDIFKRSLLEEWHGYLRDKYGSQAALTQAWGCLTEGESLDDGTILLAPLKGEGTPSSFNDTNPEAIAAFEGVKQKLGRDDFTAARTADVLEFFTGLLLSHKERLAAEFKTWGKSCRLTPLIYDTGIGESIQSQFIQQHGDAISHCAYMEGFSEKADPQDPHHPFYSVLDQYPRMGNDVPWLEHNRAPGMPFLAYEVQMGNPGKYRAEFPYRLTALAAIQDWDAAVYHFWTIVDYDYVEPGGMEGRLSFPGDAAYQYDYTYDEVAFAARRIAGLIYRHGHLPPAPDPTTFTFGRRSLYSPESMDYGGSYGPGTLQNMLYTTYRHGMRLVIDPTQEEDTVEGPVVRADSYLVPSIIRPNDAITFDTHRQQLTFDTPGAVAYAGFFANYGDDELSFEQGVSLSNITIDNPKESPYPVTDDEKYFTFGLVATDGDKPLAEARTATMSLGSTSFNTGLDLSGEKPNYGKAPVLITRVGATLHAPALDGMRYTMVDYRMQTLDTGEIKGGMLQIPADKPIFAINFERNARP